MNNREIKFRVWNKHTNGWVHGPGHECNLFGEMILLGGFMKEVSITELNDCVALQYTGVKDKLGKEIYEGDILKEYIANETQTQIGICKSVLGGWKIFSHPDSSICWQGWKSEIIGNIFENPELLKT